MVEQVITIAHNDPSLSPNAMGFATPSAGAMRGEPMLPAASPGLEVAAPSGQGCQVAPSPPGEGHELPAPSAPADDEAAEVAPEQREAIDSITVEGIALTRECSPHNPRFG